MIERGVEKVFRWFDMVIAVQKWIFDVEKGDISTMFDLGELKICTSSQRLYARKLPSKKISWRKKYGGVKNSKSVSTEDYSVEHEFYTLTWRFCASIPNRNPNN